MGLGEAGRLCPDTLRARQGSARVVGQRGAWCLEGHACRGGLAGGDIPMAYPRAAPRMTPWAICPTASGNAGSV